MHFKSCISGLFQVYHTINFLLTSLARYVQRNDAHQGVMTDRRHSLKRGDRLSKKERQTTASDWEKATNCDLCYGSKVTATFITIKQATKQLQNE
jgi:hypothetical protein